jgi:hypothetical protein
MDSPTPLATRELGGLFRYALAFSIAKREQQKSRGVSRQKYRQEIAPSFNGSAVHDAKRSAIDARLRGDDRLLAGNVAVALSIAGSGDLAALKRAASQSVVPRSGWTDKLCRSCRDGPAGGDRRSNEGRGPKGRPPP